MKGLIVALQFLTRLPTPRISVSEEEFAASMRWFPAAGLILGALLTAVAWLSAPLGPWIVALLVLLVWVGITGALHLDGLGDIADACGAAHKSRERVLAVLADPHLGSFGAVAIGLQLTSKLVLLQGVLETRALLALALVPMAARIGPLLWTLWLPDLHAGLASRFRAAVAPRHLALWAVILLVAAWFSPGLLVAPVLLLGWGAWLRRKLGGISGDGHGGGIEVTESSLLLAALVLG
jgi:adenosylcobinamide-GDP ribazoletransferase